MQKICIVIFFQFKKRIWLLLLWIQNLEKQSFCRICRQEQQPSRNPRENSIHILVRVSSCWFGEGNGTPLQCSCPENPMHGGAWWAAVHGVVKSRTWLNNFTFTFHFHALEKEMATLPTILAWRIPGIEDPSGLPSMRLHRVGHNWSGLAAAAAAVPVK